MITALTCGIVIYDEIKEIQKLLPQLKSDLSEYSVEWIFILNHEQPEIRGWISTWIKEQVSACICIENPSNNLGFARQLLLKNSTHDYIYLTDPDIDILPGNLTKLISLAQNEMVSTAHSQIIGYGGTVTHKSENHFIQSTFNFMSKLSQSFPFSFQIQNHPFLASVDHLPACHLLLHKPTALKIGGFSSALKSCGEDLDFTHRAYNEGYRFIFLPAAQVLHWQNLSLLQWFSKIFKHGRIQIPVQFMNAKFGLRYYRFIPFILLLVMGLIILFKPLVALFIVTFLLVTSAFSFGLLGFLITTTIYAAGELFEIIWPFFEYKNAEELKALNINLNNQFFLTNTNNDSTANN